MFKMATTVLKGPRILVVEDDVDQCELMCEALRMYFSDRPEMRIAAVSTIAQCLAQPIEQFDIILMDYRLPDGLGLELLDKVLARHDVPVVFVTGENVTQTANEAIAHGAQDYVVKLGDYLFALPLVVEKNIRLHQLRLENARLQEQLAASLEDVRLKNLQLEDLLQKQQAMAATDHLTGLCNRRAFADGLRRSHDEAARYGFDLTCVMCDLDNYKALNDTLGHQVGDKVLMTTAEAIRSHLRSSDIAARYGGDEFVILLPHTSVDMALGVCDRIRQQLALSTRRLAAGTGVTLSIGVASLLADRAKSADALVAQADRALYVAKARGRNRIVTFGEIDVLKPLRAS